ncbi:MAG: flagellar export chaperone FliS [Candidatus Melainabacteria bacterium RIFOXYA2_FULL_32_9]|nr:MAG: flagellar export chaperone FliS [Candidatus Melainabacteria bacterium RIFOXYA2_FULL_32_9]
MNPYLKQYQQTEVQTASPEKLLIMLYDGAIQFLNKAKVGIANKNIEEIHNNIIGAQKIISEFMNTLDIKVGGEVAQNLYNLYEYLHYRLVQANIKKDADMVDEVLTHLKDLKKTWEEAIRIAAREKIRDEEETEEENSVKTA